MGKRIFVLTQPDQAHSVQGTEVAFLFPCAVDSEIAQHFSSPIFLPELIGEIDFAKQKAADLAMKLLKNEPRFRGVPQLSIFEEVVIRELQQAFQLLHLSDFLVKKGYSLVTFCTASPDADGLARLVKIAHIPMKIISPQHHSSQLKRWWGRIKSSKFRYSALSNAIKEGINFVDPLHRRSLWLNAFKRKNIQKNQIWFYTTAVTFTNIGLHYESSFPEPLHFLVENKATGGKPLEALSRSFSFLYEFSLRQFIPKQKEIDQATQAILTHLQSVDLNQTEKIAYEMLLCGNWMQTFLSKLLPKGLFFSALLDHWCQAVCPRALIVGNPVWEGYALHITRQKRIPTLLLQHGVLGDFYQFCNYPVDHVIVRGEFWYQFLAPSTATHSIILNPPRAIKKVTKNTEKSCIVFCTFCLCDRDILKTVLEAVANAQGTLVIRVHPLERIVDYQNIVNQLSIKLSSPIEVQYSQGPGLSELLEQAAGVILSASTIFLDCLYYQTPIISFDWHHFPYKKQIKPYGVFHFAKSLSDLSHLIQQAARKELMSYQGSSELFLARTPKSVLKSTLNKMIRYA